jgi:uncharacterized protein with GYD domain
MATYVILINWTDEGARAAKDTVKRSETAQEGARRLGGEITHIWWTMGRYDLVGILEAPDDETATAIMVATGGSGMVRTETLRAFNADELGGILAKVG